MSEQDRIAFEKWAKDHEYAIDDYVYALEIWQAATAEANKRIAELQASRNNIRNVLDNLVDYCLDNNIPCREALSALALTPAESLQVHDDEVIEKCAKVCDEWIGQEPLAEAIRSLKEVK